MHKGNEIPLDREVLQHWSDLTFLTWQKLVSSKAQMQSLKGVVHCKVSNRFTIAVIESLLEKRGRLRSQHVGRVVEQYTEQDGEDFLALLGSPNGSGTGFMLAQHKDQLGRKTVKSISVVQETERILVLEIDKLS